MTTPDLQPLEDADLATVAAALRGLPPVSDRLARWSVLAVCAVLGERDWRTEDDYPDPPPWPAVDGLGLCDLAAIVAMLDRLPARTPELATFEQQATMQVLAVVAARIDASRQRRQGDEIRRDRQGRVL